MKAFIILEVRLHLHLKLKLYGLHCTVQLTKALLQEAIDQERGNKFFFISFRGSLKGAPLVAVKFLKNNKKYLFKKFNPVKYHPPL